MKVFINDNFEDACGFPAFAVVVAEDSVSAAELLNRELESKELFAFQTPESMMEIKTENSKVLLFLNYEEE